MSLEKELSEKGGNLLSVFIYKDKDQRKLLLIFIGFSFYPCFGIVHHFVACYSWYWFLVLIHPYQLREQTIGIMEQTLLFVNPSDHV